MDDANRRLAGILAADVVGYSGMVGKDEPAALARVRLLRTDLIEPLAASHGGRLFKTTGDGFLAAFASAVQALRCAVAMQERLSSAPDGLRLRIGVHQGEVVAEGDDLLGDGVIIAARLEPLAEPGGICISARVREDAAGKMALEVDDLGTPELKNLAAKVQVFRVRLGMAELPAALPLPDKPSLVVLPFQNMSGDPEQEYFADGMVEEITTGLSRVKSFFLISRNSAFAYKGRAVDAKQVGRELGVRYVLEGSVREAGNRVRITGQLIDASSGAHVWADRFEGTLEDIFALQDRVTSSVVAAVDPEIVRAEIRRARHTSISSQSAYDLHLQALPHFHLRSREGIAAATRLLAQAVEIDPTRARASAALAFCHWIPWQQGWMEEPRKTLDEIMRLAQVALQQDSEDPLVLNIVAMVITYAGRDAHTGLALVEKALALNPNSAEAHRDAGELRAYLGDPETGIEHLEQSVRLNPLADAAYTAYRNLAFTVAHFVAGRYPVALDFSERALRDSPNLAGAMRWRAAILGLLGREDEARQTVQQLESLAPGWTVSRMRALTAIKVPEVVDALCEGLRLAGLPE
jgi:adenylate cyclase